MPTKTLRIKHCPFCNGEIIEQDDHHGTWWGHVETMGNKCIAAHIQLHDAKDIEAWNTRASCILEEDMLTKHKLTTLLARVPTRSKLRANLNGNLEIYNSKNVFIGFIDFLFGKLVRVVKKGAINGTS